MATPTNCDNGDPMTEDELYKHAFESRMFRDWHWFRWHFEHRLHGRDHPLATSIVRACLDVEEHVPGFAIAMFDEIASVAGMKKFLPHWEQLLQRLCELLVIRHVCKYGWSGEARFQWEPTAGESAKNPELAVHTSDRTYGLEVKAPSIIQHWRERTQNPTQVPSRSMPKEEIQHLPNAEAGITLPRDNPVKDFLVSAQEKFSAFQAEDERFVGILVIVWDDFIYEPISALIHPDCGLFTPNSFARSPDGEPMSFPAVTGVVTVRHLHQLIRACRDEPLADSCQHALDYGRSGEFPYKAFIQNPGAPECPSEILDCLQAAPPHPSMGAEYMPKDLVWWFGPLESR